MLARALSLALGSILCACGNSPSAPDGGGPIEPTYENVEMILTSACAFSSCHGGAGAGAGRLNFQTAIAMGTLREVMLDVPSCEYSAMPLVDPGDPDNSWLYLKIAGPHTGMNLDFTPDPGWDPGIMRGPDGRYPSSICPLTSGGEISFGTIMPQLPPFSGLDAPRAEAIRAWIAAGAPGPAAP